MDIYHGEASQSKRKEKKKEKRRDKREKTAPAQGVMHAAMLLVASS